MLYNIIQNICILLLYLGTPSINNFLVLWFCGILKQLRYFWLSNTVTDRKPMRHRPTRTWADLPIQMLKKFRVKNIFSSSRKNRKIENLKFPKIENFDFLNSGKFRKLWFFGKNLGAFWCFLMIHEATRANGDSFQVTVDSCLGEFLRHLTWLNTKTFVDLREANRTRVD